MGQPGLCFLHCFCLTIDHWSPLVQPRCTRSNTEGRLCIMPEKKVSAPAAEAPAAEGKTRKSTKAPAAEALAAEGKTRKSTKAPARRGRPPLAPELYVEMGGEQYNITDIIDRAKADYRTTHKVGVQSCKVYVKPEEGAAYYVINKFSGKLDL